MRQLGEKTEVLLRLKQDQADLVLTALSQCQDMMEDALANQINRTHLAGKNYDEDEFRADVTALMRSQETYLQIERKLTQAAQLDIIRRTQNE